jgi:hypothetical protein
LSSLSKTADSSAVAARLDVGVPGKDGLDEDGEV